jgi:hypothetical protein
MPYGNGTGPAGMGPMTGRGAGFCAGHGVPGFANRGPGQGGGFGRGGGRGGRGFRNMYWATGLTGWQRAMMAPPVPFAPYQPTTEQELEALKGQVRFMEDSVRQAQERIRELEQQKDKK